MDVQKYIKRLKFARADWSRNIGDFHSKEDALNFLNGREFFFGDPFVVKYTENGETKLMLAIGKSENPEITADTTEVTGGVGPDAYELFDMNEFREAIEELEETTSGLTEDVRELYEIINDLTGSTADLLEITGEGWTDSPTNVTLTDRLKKDEELMKVVWEFNHGGSGVYEPRFNDVPIEIDYDATHNRIRLVAGEATTEYIQLNGAAEVFTRIEYIPELEVIRFWYMPSGNPDPQEEYFDIDVHALIEEWETEDTDTVKLTRERVVAGKDKLTADVKISADGDNMLEVVSDGLKVEDVRPEIQEIQEHLAESDEVTSFALNRLAEAIASNVGGLEQERNERIAGDAELNERIDEVNEKVDELESVVTEEQEVTATALNRLAEGLDQERQERIGGDMATLGMANARMDDIQGQLDDEKLYRKRIKLVQINPNDFERLGIGNDVRDAYFLTEHMPQSTEPYTDPVPGQPIIKVYKDSVIYRIYFGHVDDTFINGETTTSTDPTIVPGTGDTAICFIYFNAQGDYALATNRFDAGEALEELEAVVDEMQEVTSTALNRLAEAVERLGIGFENLNQDLENLQEHVEETDEVTAIALNRIVESLANLANQVYENTADIAELRDDVDDIDEKVGAGFLGGGFQVDITRRIKDIEDNIIGRRYPGGPANNYIVVGDHRELLGIPPYAVGSNIEGQINSLNQAIGNTNNDVDNLEDLVDRVRRIDDTFELTVDTENAVISFTWTDENGQQRHTSINVSDFTKDSFLDGVQVVTHEGVQCLEFSFRTYDGEPVPIYIPLTDLAVLYSAGDGIDRQELEDNQVITVKIDDFGEFPNYLAKSANGLRVTGVTEAIQEAVAEEAQARQEEDERLWDALNNEITARTAADNEIREELYELSASTDSRFEQMTEIISGVTGETLSEYVRKDEVEDHLDSASTLPVQNQVVTNALNDLVEQVEEMLENLTAITANTIITNELTASTANIENLYTENAEIDHITAQTIVTNEITGDTAFFSGLTANTIYADEYQNLPTATTEQFGVVILDDELSLESANPVQNSAITQVILENEETVAAALNDLNDRKADKTYVDAADQNLQEQIDGIVAGGLTNVRTEGSGNVVTAVTRSDNDVVAHLGTVDTSNITAQTINTSAFTATTANIENLTANTIVTNEITATTANIENLTAQTIVTEEITANTANFTGVTANTLDVDNITAQTILTNTITGNTANFTGMTATTISATTYNNLPTASTTNYGVVILDGHLDSGSTNPVENKAIFKECAEIEEVCAAAFNDLNDRKADKSYVDTLISDMGGDMERLSSQMLTGVTNTTSTGTTGVEVVTSLTVNGHNVVGNRAKFYTIEQIDDLVAGVTGGTQDGFVSKAVFTGYTGSTQTVINNLSTNKADKSYVDGNFVHDVEYYSTGSTHELRFKDAGNNVIATVNASDFIKDGMVESVTISGGNLVITFNTDSGKQPISIPLTNIFNPENYYTKEDIDSMLVVDDQPDTGSTNPIQNKVITQIIIDNEEVVAAALNDLNDRKADKTYVDQAIENIDLSEYVDNNTFNNFTGSTLNGVTTAGTGNVVGSIQKAGTNVQANMIDVPTRSEFNTLTGSTITGVTSDGTTGNVITAIAKNGNNVVYSKGNVDLSSTLTGVTASTATAAQASATTSFVSAIVKDGQNVKATVTPFDTALSTGSTNAVQNKEITRVIIENEQITAAALNDLNNRKANIEDIPVTINDLDGSENIAMKSDLAGYLPLSGGTMTGNISGSTGNAIFMPGGFFQQSDETLKIFMGDIENALEKANKIPTKYFYWKDRYDGPRELGTSAQKVQEVFPEIVSGGDKLSVDYSKLAIVALAAIKELTAKVEDLQNQLNELKK